VDRTPVVEGGKVLSRLRRRGGEVFGGRREVLRSSQCFCELVEVILVDEVVVVVGEEREVEGRRRVGLWPVGVFVRISHNRVLVEQRVASSGRYGVYAGSCWGSGVHVHKHVRVMVEALRHHGGTLTGRQWPGIFRALKQLNKSRCTVLYTFGAYRKISEHGLGCSADTQTCLCT
jgi:hypothetical protein